jgi:hypothetical protein
MPPFEVRSAHDPMKYQCVKAPELLPGQFVKSVLYSDPGSDSLRIQNTSVSRSQIYPRTICQMHRKRKGEFFIRWTNRLAGIVHCASDGKHLHLRLDRPARSLFGRARVQGADKSGKDAFMIHDGKQILAAENRESGRKCTESPTAELSLPAIWA